MNCRIDEARMFHDSHCLQVLDPRRVDRRGDELDEIFSKSPLRHICDSRLGLGYTFAKANIHYLVQLLHRLIVGQQFQACSCVHYAGFTYNMQLICVYGGSDAE